MFCFCMEETKRDNEDMTVVNYTIITDYENIETEDIKTKSHGQFQHTELNTAGRNCYRLTAVCAVLMCVLLLAGVTVLWIKYNILSREHNQLEQERSALHRVLLKSGWRVFRQSIYYISTQKKNWTESRADCIKRGSDLVIVDSREEQEAPALSLIHLSKLSMVFLGPVQPNTASPTVVHLSMTSSQPVQLRRAPVLQLLQWASGLQAAGLELTLHWCTLHWGSLSTLYWCSSSPGALSS